MVQRQANTISNKVMVRAWPNSVQSAHFPRGECPACCAVSQSARGSAARNQAKWKMDEPQQNTRCCAQAGTRLWCLQKAWPGIVQERGVSAGVPVEQGTGTFQPAFYMTASPLLARITWKVSRELAGRSSLPSSTCPQKGEGGQCWVQQEGLGAGFGQQRIKESKLHLLSTNKAVEGRDGERQQAIRGDDDDDDDGD